MFRVLLIFLVGLTMMGCNQSAGGVNIFEAVENNDSKKIDKFAKSGGDLNVKKLNGTTPLWVALSEKKKESYEALLKNGADPNVIMSGKRVVTHWAALNYEDSWWLKLALQHGADPNLVNVGCTRPSAGTPLKYAIIGNPFGEDPGVLENVSLLVEQGADVNKPDLYNAYPLSIALDQKDFRIVLYLLDQGTDYHLSKRDGIKFVKAIRQKIKMKNDFFLLKEDRDDLDAVRDWLVDHNVDVVEK